MRHGYSAYRNHACRCGVCREGNRLYSRAWRAARGQPKPPRYPDVLERVQKILDEHRAPNGNRTMTNDGYDRLLRNMRRLVAGRKQSSTF